MAFENHGGPCKSGCERIACMCAHEKLARVLKETESERDRLRAALDSERNLNAKLRAVADAAKKAFVRRNKVTPEHWWIQEEHWWAVEEALKAAGQHTERSDVGVSDE